jgi:hypothetical protein
MGTIFLSLLAPQGLLIYTFGNLRSIYRFILANMAISGTTGHVTLMLLCFYSMYENLNPIIVIFSGCTVMHSQSTVRSGTQMHSKAQSGTQNAQSNAQSMHSMHSKAQSGTVKCTVHLCLITCLAIQLT